MTSSFQWHCSHSDEFENGLRLVAERSGVVAIGVDYRLAPEHHFPTQIDEYSTVVDWAQGHLGREARSAAYLPVLCSEAVIRRAEI